MELKIENQPWMKESISIKLLIIGFLIILLFIPSKMVESLIHERNKASEGVTEEVSEKWGKAQVITGPVLTVPYKVTRTVHEKAEETTAHAFFLPELLKIDGTILPEIRKRSIYKVVLYNSQLTISGEFLRPDFGALNVSPENALWREAYLTIGITDLRGVRKKIEIKWNGENIVTSPGVNTRIVEAGVTSRIVLDSTLNKFQFLCVLDLNGSKQIRFVPTGKETNVTLGSKWPSPGFNGAFLPAKVNITDDSFHAEWNTLYLNRNFPQQWTSFDKQDVSASSFGVDLILPVDHYQKATRSTKYAILFLFLTFLIFFINEVVNKYRTHPVQYLLIGLALIIFYVLLVSLSEYIWFNYAYLIASLATVGLITVYSASMIRRKLGTILIGMFLALLYGFLFILLQLEDYALLLGGIGLFLILAVVMYASRKVNWYKPIESTESN